MTTSSSRQPNDWNTFQRENKGRWNKDELKKQWQLRKQRDDGQEPASSDTTVAASSNSRARQLSTLKEGLKALVVSSHTQKSSYRTAGSSDVVYCSVASTADQAASSPAACCAAAVDDAQLTCDNPNSTSAVCSLYVSCNGTPTSSAHQPTQQQSPVQRCPVHLQECAGRPPPGHPAVVDASPLPAAADAAAAAAAAGICNADVSPCINLDLVQPTTVSAQELAKLREAVYHLLSKQAGMQPPQLQRSEPACVVDEQQHSSSVIQQDHHHQNQQHHQQQQGGLQHGITSQELTLLPAPTALAGQPLAVSTGCFGLSWGSHSQLSWNAFQKACKGRGLSRSEISAAYQQAKQHYLETGQLLELDALLLQQQQQQLQQQRQPQLAHAREAGASSQQQQQQQGRWSSVQHWVRSRAASRAPSRSCSTAVSPNSSPARPTQLANSQHSFYTQPVNEGGRRPRRSGIQQWLHSHAASRAASRACSAAVSPNTSPTVRGAQQRVQHQYAGDYLGTAGAGAAGEGSKWGAFKEWLHSRGSSRANSRLGTPAASPGQHYLTACAEEQQQQQKQQQRYATDQNTNAPPQQQQQQQTQRWRVREQEGIDADADAPYLPFAQQLQGHLGQPREQQQAGSSGADPQTSDHRGTCVSNSSGSSKTEQVQQEPIGGIISRVGLHMPLVAAAGAAAETAVAAVSPIAKQPASSPPQPSAAAAAAAAAAVAVEPSASAAQTAVSATAAPLTAAAAVLVLRIGHRLVRESVCDDLTGVLDGFSPWLPVEPQHIRKLKKAVPQQPGLYEWGVRLPYNRSIVCSSPRCSDSSSNSSSSSITAGSAGTPAQQYGRVLAFYLGKAGTLKSQRPRRSASQYGPVGYTGETLRSRLSNYLYARSGRLGPTNEPHKLAFFQRQLQAGGKLYLRWRVCSTIEPLEAETYLLNRLDYAANYMNNRGRRPLITQ